MRFLLLAALIGCIGAVFVAAQGSSSVVYVGHDKVAAAIANGGPLVSGRDYAVSMQRRIAPGQVEVHQKETDTFYIVEGEATFITGGKMIGGHTTTPGQERGTRIEGGQTHHLGKGDVIVIASGTPHWFKEVSNPFVYYTVKVIR
jgi:mannose-6-phosphate isomerase-like protein (cupin superfamily)